MIEIDETDMNICDEFINPIFEGMKGKRKVKNNKLIYEAKDGFSNMVERRGFWIILPDGEEKIITPETLFLTVVYNFKNGDRDEACYRQKYITAPPIFSEETILQATYFKGDTVLLLTEFIELDDEEFEEFEADYNDEQFPRALSEFF